MRALRWRAALLASAFGSSAAVLQAFGSGTLAPPSAGSWQAASDWYAEAGPVVATIAGLRLAAMVVALWLCAATLLQLLATVPLGGALCRPADLLAPSLVRQALRGAAGVSLSAGLVLPAAGLFDGAPPAGPPAGTATMRPLDTEAATAPDPAPVPPTTVPEVVPVAVEPQAETYQVVPGSHLWAIAEEVVADSLGRAPSDRETHGYWLRLIEANRDRLVVPGNPDLIYPGQLLVLPPS